MTSIPITRLLTKLERPCNIECQNPYLWGGPEVGGHLRDDQHQLVQDGGSCRITPGGNNIKLGQKLTPTEYLEMLVLY